MKKNVLLGGWAGLAAALLMGILPALASRNENGNWLIEKWSERPTVGNRDRCVNYHLRVTRKGPPVSGAVLTDYRDASYTTNYGAAQPPPDAGGGTASSAAWNLPSPMNPGETFEAVVRVDTTGSTDFGANNVAEISGADGLRVSYRVGGETEYARTAGGNPAAPLITDPVNAALGEFFFDAPPDLDLGGVLPLRFERFYSSRMSDSGTWSMKMSWLDTIPNNWMNNFDLNVVESKPGFPKVYFERGDVITFAAVSNAAGVQYTLNYRQEPVAWQLQRDGAGHWWFLDPLRERVFRFNAQGYLREIMDRNENRLWIERDSPTGKVTQVTDQQGRVLSFTYGWMTDYWGISNVWLTQVHDGVRAIGFGYHPLRYLESCTNALGGVTWYQSITNARPPCVEWITRPCGNTPIAQQYRWLPKQVTNQCDAYGHATRIEYNVPLTGWTTIWFPDGHTAAFSNTDQRLGAVLQDGAGNTVVNEYNTRDQLVTVSNRLAARTTFAYEEESGKMAALTNAEGRVLAFAYATVTQTFVNAETLSNTVTFAFQDLVRLDYPDGAHEEFAPDARGNPRTQTDRQGGTWSYGVNARGQVVAITNPAGGVQSFAYRTNGLPLAWSDTDGRRGAYGCDDLFRVTSVTNADGTARRMVYDAANRLTDLYDEQGERWQFRYDANGNLVEHTDPLGFATTYDYDLMDRLTNVADAGGALFTRAYDSMGRPALLAAAGGAPVLFAYDVHGWVTNVSRGDHTWRTDYDREGVPVSRTLPGGGTTRFLTDRLGGVTGTVDATGQAWRIGRDPMQRVASVTDPLGQATRFTYNGQGRVTSVTRPLVGTSSNTFNTLGLLSRRRDYNGADWSYSYTPMGQLLAATNPLGLATRYTFNLRGQPVRVDFADGSHEQYAYDAAGRLQTWTDGAGHAWGLGYNARGDTTSLTNPAGGILRMARDPVARSVARWDDDTGVQATAYDGLDRPVQVTWPDGATRHISYHATNDLPETLTDENGNIWRYDYDADGNLARATDPHGQADEYVYDALGRLTRRTDRTGRTTTYAYDEVGRLAQTVSPGGYVTSNTYDAAGHRTAVTRGGRTWQATFDNEGRLTARQSPLGSVTRYERDAVGQVTGVVNALGERSSLARDGRGRITAVTDPRGRTRTFTYDGAGRLVAASEPGLGQATCAWTPLHRLASVTDLNTQAWTFAYSTMGRLQAQTDPLGQATAYGWDARGRVGAFTNADGTTATLTYDPAGRATNLADSTGLTLNWAYDACGRWIGTDGLSLQYDAMGRLTNILEDGVSFTASYDADGRLAAAGYCNGALTVTYAYDPAHGRLARVADSLSGASVDFLYDDDLRPAGVRRSNGVHLTNTWDAADRLTRVQDGGVLDVQQYADAGGCVTQAVENAPLDPADFVVPATNRWTVNAAGQISAAGFSYDTRGRLIQAPGIACAWDGASRLVRINDVELAYNGIGQLVTRAAGGATNRFFTHYAIGHSPIVAERDESTGQVRRYYVWTPDGQLLYFVDAAAGHPVRFYHFDPLGSTRALTDAGGGITDAYAYDPHGRIVGRTGTSDQPFTFAGRWGVRQEGTHGLYHMRTRYYDALTARFLSRDAIWPRPARPLALNPSLYAMNNPIGAVDPSGQMPFDALAILFAQAMNDDQDDPRDPDDPTLSYTDLLRLVNLTIVAQQSEVEMDWTEMVELVGPYTVAILRYAARHPEVVAELRRRSDQERGRRNGQWNAVARQVWGLQEAPSQKPGWRTPDEWIRPAPGFESPLPATPPRTPAHPMPPGSTVGRPWPSSGVGIQNIDSSPAPVMPPYLPPTAPGGPLRVNGVQIQNAEDQPVTVVITYQPSATTPPGTPTETGPTWRTPDEWIHPAPRPEPALPPPSDWRTPDEWIQPLPPPENAVLQRQARLEEIRRQINAREAALARDRKCITLAREVQADKDHPLFYFCAYFWDWALNLAPMREYSASVEQELGSLRQELAALEQQVPW